MHALVMLSLWLHSLPVPAPVAKPLSEGPGQVMICSPGLAEVQGEACKQFKLSMLGSPVDRSSRSASGTGQVAFIDPATLEPSAPTEGQLNELAGLVRIDEEVVGPRLPLQVEELPDGTLRVRLDESFQVRVTATIEKLAGDDSPNGAKQ